MQRGVAKDHGNLIYAKLYNDFQDCQKGDRMAVFAQRVFPNSEQQIYHSGLIRMTPGVGTRLTDARTYISHRTGFHYLPRYNASFDLMLQDFTTTITQLNMPPLVSVNPTIRGGFPYDLGPWASHAVAVQAIQPNWTATQVHIADTWGGYVNVPHYMWYTMSAQSLHTSHRGSGGGYLW